MTQEWSREEFQGRNRPLSAPNPKSKLAIPRTLVSMLIPRGIHRDRKTRDKPITRPSRKNKPENIPGQEEDLEKKSYNFRRSLVRESGLIRESRGPVRCKSQDLQLVRAV